jgi:hypothetical protein
MSTSTSLDARQVLYMTSKQLDELFLRSVAGPIPTGESNGTMILPFGTGTRFARLVAVVVHAVHWKGKIFYPEQGMLYNKVSPLGIKVEKARVYTEASWLDGREAIIVDYSTTASFISRGARDEVRQVAPGLYLGIVYSRKTRKRLFYFLLEF